MRRTYVIVAKLVAIVLVGLLLSGCSSFDTQECGDKYLHVSYGGGLSGYRLVALSNSPNMGFNVRGTSDWDKWTKYKNDETPKVAFENENTIAVTCRSRITFLTGSPPAVNTMGQSANTKVVAPHKLIDLDTAAYDIVIR